MCYSYMFKDKGTDFYKSAFTTLVYIWKVMDALCINIG